MTTENLISLAKKEIQKLRDPETAKVYAAASQEAGSGWYDIGVEDETGDVTCLSSAHTDIGSHADRIARDIATALNIGVIA